MFDLIRFEMKKIINLKKICFVFFLVLLVHFALHYEYINLSGYGYFATKDSEIVVGREAGRLEKEIALKYEGKLTDGKIQSMLEELSFSEEQIRKNLEADGKVNNHFLYYMLYHFLSKTSYDLEGFKGNFSDEVVDSFYIGYSEPWSKMIYFMTYDFLLLGFITVILIAPVFSQDYTAKMDSLILTSENGHVKTVFAKLISSYIISFTMAVVTVILNIGFTGLLFGTGGLRCSAQLTNPYMLENVQYIISLGRVCVISILLLGVGILMICSVTFLCSSRINSSYGAVICAALFYVLPILFPVLGINKKIVNLFPINFLQLYDVLELNSSNNIYILFIVLFALFISGNCIMAASRGYVNRQVK